LRCQAGRYPPRAADQGRTRYQSDHCPGEMIAPARPYVAAVSGPHDEFCSSAGFIAVALV
jgi:hypothetical protein